MSPMQWWHLRKHVSSWLHGAPVMFSFINVYCIEAAMKWLASQKPEDFEKKCEEYIEHVFPTVDSDHSSVSLDLDTNARLKERCTTHRTYGFAPEFLLFIWINYPSAERAIKCVLRYVLRLPLCKMYLIKEVAGPSYRTLWHCRRGQGGHWNCKISSDLSMWPRWAAD